MALNNVLLISQISGYVIAFILSLCIIIPMTLHQDEFRGHCLLFSNGTWTDEGQLNIQWASQAYCNYTIFVGVALLLVSAFQIYRMSKFLYKRTDSDFLSAFIDVVSSTVLFLMTVIAALMITLGFMVWCRDMTERFPSCEIAAGNAFDRLDRIDTSNFHIEIATAQFGAWASMACWVGLSVFALLKLCRYHQLENMRVSMYRERQRLINEGARGAAATAAGVAGPQDNLAATSGTNMGTGGGESSKRMDDSEDASVSVVSPKSD